MWEYKTGLPDVWPNQHRDAVAYALCGLAAPLVAVLTRLPQMEVEKLLAYWSDDYASGRPFVPKAQTHEALQLPAYIPERTRVVDTTFLNSYFVRNNLHPLKRKPPNDIRDGRPDARNKTSPPRPAARSSRPASKY
jgi:hypothetical protein